MRWSYKLFRAFGIDVRVHITFLLLIGLVVMLSAKDQGIWQAINSALIVILVFGTVVLHEFGHSLAAMHYGVPVKDITLLPIGGVARLGFIPRNPWQEFVIAVAGPAVNVVLAGICFPIVIGASFIELTSNVDILSGGMLMQFFSVNLVLLIFNLIPAFPMDGGRILRSLLAMRMNYLNATRIAARVGQFVCLLFFIYGITSGAPMLSFIAIFIYFGAADELRAVEMGAAWAAQGEATQAAGQWSAFSTESEPLHEHQTQSPNSPFSADDIPPQDMSTRYQELQDRGERVTAVYANGRIVAVIRDTDS